MSVAGGSTAPSQQSSHASSALTDYSFSRRASRGISTGLSVLARAPPNRFLSAVSQIVQLLQLISFPLDSDFSWGSKGARAIFRVPRSIRALDGGYGDSSPRIFSALIGLWTALCLIGLLVNAVVVYRRVRRLRKDRNERFASLQANSIALVGGPLLSPIINTSLAMVGCGSVFPRSCGGSSSGILIALSVLILVTAIFAGAVHALYHYEISCRKRSAFALLSPEPRLLLASALVVLNFVTRFTRPELLPAIARPVAVGGATAVFATWLAWYVCKAQPFYSPMLNHGVAAASSAALASSLAVVVGHWAPVAGFAVFWAALLPCAAVGFLASLFWYRVSSRVLRTAVREEFVDTTASTTTSRKSGLSVDAGRILRSETDLYVVVTRIFWEECHRASFDPSTASDLLRPVVNDAVDLEIQSVDSEIIRCLFLHETDSGAAFSLRLSRVEQKSSNLLQSIVIEHLAQVHAESVDRNSAQEVAARLVQLDKFRKHADRVIAKFWKDVLFAPNLKRIPGFVSQVAGLSARAKRTFMLLTNSFPSSSEVLRHYSQFVSEVECEADIALELLHNAEALEETKSKAHSRRHGLSRMAELLQRKESPPEPQPTREDEASTGRKTDAEVRFEQSEADDAANGKHVHAVHMVSLSETQRESGIVDASQLQQEKAQMAADKASSVYRERLVHMSSRATTILFASVIVLVAVLVMNVCITYGLSTYGMTAYNYTFNGVSRSSDAVQFVSTLADSAIARSMCLTDFECASRKELRKSAKLFSELLNAMYFEATSVIYYPFSWWNEPIYNMSVWDGVPVNTSNPNAAFNRTYSMVPIITLLTEAVRQAYVLDAGNFTSKDELYNSEGYRFFGDNELVIRTAAASIIKLYSDSLSSTANTDTIILSVVVGSTTGVFLVFCLGIFLYASIMLKTERHDVYSLFLAVPKGALFALLRKYERFDEEKLESFGKDDHAVEHAMSNSVADAARIKTISVKGIDRLAALLIIGTAIMIGLLLGVLGLTVSMFTSSSAPIDLISSRTDEFYYTKEVVALSTALVSDDYFSVAFDEGEASVRSQIVDSTKSFLDAKSHSLLLQGAYSLDLIYPSVRNISLLRNCSYYLGNESWILEGQRCVGLADADNFIVTRSIELVAEVNMTIVNQIYQRLAIMESAATLWRMDTMDEFQNIMMNKLGTQRIIVATLFAISIPCALVLYMIMHVPLQKIRKQYTAILKMLLMVPGDVLQSVPQISNFFEEGRQTYHADKQLAANLEKTRAQTDRILSAASDAIIVYSASTKVIEKANPATTGLFQYSVTELVGTSLSLLVPDEFLDNTCSETLGTDFNIFATRKDRTSFPVFISRSVTGEVGAIFIRDVSQLAEMQVQRDRLLSSILPKSIATRLLFNGDEHQAIADSYKHVSILFADIVKFTNWSSTMDPQALVDILNDLVSMWDSIALKCHVEKIKTIGDCYMCVTGCPEEDADHAEHIVQFAIRMMRSLKAFNEKHKLNLHTRVGINSGSVVAGVIGLSKVVFDLWGAPVNLASRMESNGLPDTIQISEATYTCLPEKMKGQFKNRGEIEVKGGILVNTYTLSNAEQLDSSDGMVAEALQPAGASFIAILNRSVHNESFRRELQSFTLKNPNRSTTSHQQQQQESQKQEPQQQPAEAKQKEPQEHNQKPQEEREPLQLAQSQPHRHHAPGTAAQAVEAAAPNADATTTANNGSGGENKSDGDEIIKAISTSGLSIINTNISL